MLFPISWVVTTSLSSTKSAYQWRRSGRAGGEAALASKGPGGNACKLDGTQLARLRAALDLGPAAYGWNQAPLSGIAGMVITSRHHTTIHLMYD